MTRLEENRMAVNGMVESARRNPAETYNDMVAFQLCTIATMLTDISKSLAILADKAEREIRNERKTDKEVPEKADKQTQIG